MGLGLLRDHARQHLHASGRHVSDDAGGAAGSAGGKGVYAAEGVGGLWVGGAETAVYC